MARLIDADALMRDIGETVIFSGKPDRVSAELRGARKVVDRIEAAPTVDAVEVVRCCECKHYRESEHPEMAGIRFCYRLMHPTEDRKIGYNFADDDFCSYGERRENEQTRENA
jgi:hypothetical protein